MSGIWKKYLQLLDTSPLITKSITSGVLVAGGDAVAQLFIEKAPTYDFGRTLRFGTFGTLFVGPVMHKWYAVLQKLFPADNMSSAVKKLMMDQVIFAPFIVASFFTGITLLEGQGFGEVKKKFQNSYLEAMKMNYFIWPAAQSITFTVIPYNLRVPWVSCVSLVWNTVLSLITNKNNNNNASQDADNKNANNSTKIVAIDEKRSK
eukprot:TRINITY_DN634_c0_g1_i1.p1 TRINITY_DN634_c0_g1~~TRINITY_DN634_c0_g1_i1.p1  ORF type:complete len:205 (+),score=63.50 TRINITY_DN634_c0_g1_i1:66-680(+)